MGTIMMKLQDLWFGSRNLVSPTSEPDALQKQTAEFERLSDYVYALLREEDPEAVIVFFHGLLVDESEQKHAFWTTWKMRNNNDCWPITLLPKYLKDLVTEGHPYKIRVLAVSYDSRTALPGKSIDDYLNTEAFIQDLVLSQFCRGKDDGDVPIFLVGHDLGGILIKSFIMAIDGQTGIADKDKKEKLGRFLGNLKAVMFYATPHKGSKVIEDMTKDIQVSTRNPMLELMKVLGHHMSRINSDFANCTYRKGPSGFNTYAVVSTCQTNQKGFRNVMVVEEGSARCDVDDYYPVPDADHFQVCQPEGIWSYSMTKLGSMIHDEVSKIRDALQVELSLPSVPTMAVRLPSVKRDSIAIQLP